MRQLLTALLALSLVAAAPAIALAHGGSGSYYCVDGRCYHYPGVEGEYWYDPYDHHYDVQHRYDGPLYDKGYWHWHTETRGYWHWHERRDNSQLGAFLVGAFLGYLLGIPAH